MRLLFLIIGAQLILSGCRTYSEDDKQVFDEQIERYIRSKGIKGMTRTDSGLYYKIIDQGSERKIKYKDQVYFKYKGTLKDGNVFDDQKEAGQTFHVSELIAAWKEVMMELGEGGKCYLISPPQLGYGNYDLEKIPPNSILIYELEICEVR